MFWGRKQVIWMLVYAGFCSLGTKRKKTGSYNLKFTIFSFSVVSSDKHDSGLVQSRSMRVVRMYINRDLNVSISADPLLSLHSSPCDNCVFFNTIIIRSYHETLNDAKVVVDNLGDGSQAVSCTGGVAVRT